MLFGLAAQPATLLRRLNGPESSPMKLMTLLFTLTLVPIGQAGSTRLAGSWTAEFEGKTFIRLELNAANGGITGGISLGNIELDPQGAVRRANPVPPGLKPISNVVQRESTLAFVLNEGDEPDRFEFRLLDGGRAELHFLLSDDDREELAANGIAAFRPIVLTRQ